jgi:ABC-2 type transport system ATP-binding protein
MHALLGFVKPTGGVARIFGTDVQTSIARQRLGYLPEHPDAYRFLTGIEALTAAGRMFGMGRARLQERVTDVLDLVGLDCRAARRRIATYSRGMMQRIALAQALVHDPDLLILDEPTGGLDPLGRVAIRDLIGTLKRAGKTVFFSSHELSEAELVCDRVAVLVAGRIAVEGPAAELVTTGERLEAFFLRVVTSASAAAAADAGKQGAPAT